MDFMGSKLLISLMWLFSNSCGCIIYHSDFHCQNLSLNEIPYYNLENVTSFNVSKNFLSRIDSQVFRNSVKLIEIDMTSNNISYVEKGSFYNQLDLKILILERNNLSYFNSSTIFSLNSPIENLNLKLNQLEQVDVMSLQNLKILEVGHNALRTFALSASNMESLEELYLGSNMLEYLSFPQGCHNSRNSIKIFDMHHNRLKNVTFLTSCRFLMLEKLNLADNAISLLPQNAFASLPSLNLLILDGNPIISISDFAFNGLNQLSNLQLNNLFTQRHLFSENIFKDLLNLNSLQLRSNQMTMNHNFNIFKHLSKLQMLDLSNNSLSHIDIRLFMFLKNLKFLNLSSNEWICDCSQMLLNKILSEKFSHGLILQDLHLTTCKYPKHVVGNPLLEVINNLNCSNELHEFQESFVFRGSNVALDCDSIDGDDNTNDFVWMKVDRNYEIFFNDGTLQSPNHFISQNGSLLIDDVDSSDLGLYECYNNGLLRKRISLKFDYEILTRTTFEGMLMGLVTSASVLLFAILFGAIRTCCKMCSQKEKERKSSMKEVLGALKISIQSDRFHNYKTAQIERFTAFRSATLEQISSFKSAKVSRLRKYKQASVNGILHCLDRMRIHYSNQSLKIKNNCQQQFDKLRDNYVNQKTKFKDNRSHQVRKIRENYQGQALKVKSYGVHQMSRLRDQYKIQQQNLMKLLELLEVGNCLHVIEAECSRTESIIFDSEIVNCDVTRSDVFDQHGEDDDDDVFELPPLLGGHNNVISDDLPLTFEVKVIGSTSGVDPIMDGLQPDASDESFQITVDI